MSLNTRMILGVLASALCTALLAAAATLGMSQMRGHFTAAADQYDELRSIYEIGHRAALVRATLETPEPDRATILRQLAAAQRELDALRAGPYGPGAGGALDAPIEAIAADLASMRRRVETATALAGATGELDRAIGRVATLAGEAKTSIIKNRSLASAEFDRAQIAMALWLALAIAVSLAAGLLQRRAVMRPVRALDRAVSQLADADFTCRVPPQGASELRRLVQRFNEMSDEIRRLHDSMQAQVETRTRQLARAERLAGLGRLAAGVAHEINNPLAIIAGHAESAARRLERRPEDPESSERAAQALTIITEEAFRCREITSELLNLAAPSAGREAAIDAARLTERAVRLARGLPSAAGRAIDLRVEPGAGGALVTGDEPQLLQVLINLIANGLEACAGEGGRVRVAVRRETEALAIEVADNGRGMTEPELAKAFDPFQTSKPRRGLAGAGLGLTVSHAIIDRHGGRIEAASDGPGNGSTLTIRLPIRATAEVAVHA